MSKSLVGNSNHSEASDRLGRGQSFSDVHSSVVTG